MTRKEIKTKFKCATRSTKAKYKTALRAARRDFKTTARSLRQSCKDGVSTAKAEYKADTLHYYTERGKRPPVDPPKRALLEEIGNSVTHGAGAIFAIVAFVLMLAHSTRPDQYVGAVMYFFGLFTMCTVSCLYHAFAHGSAVKRLFRRFDYSCIYLLIGATFAPILLSYIGGVFGTVFFVIQWLIIATGISLVGVFGPGRLRFIHIPLYLALGWVGLILLPRMIAAGDLAFLWFILGGGIIYSVGIIPFAMKTKVAHFIWHFFVLAGAVVQWVGIYLQIYLG